METWKYEQDDVLLIQRNGEEVIARVDGFVDYLDDTKPLYCNLRAVGNAWWRKSVIKVQPDQIIKLLPTWEEDHKAEVIEKYQASIKEVADRRWARMSPEARQRLVALARRSPLDILIDRACGLE